MEHTKQFLRVAEIETVAPYVNRYRFTAAQGAPAPFLPGQFLCLYYEIDGATSAPIPSPPPPRRLHKGGTMTCLSMWVAALPPVGWAGILPWGILSWLPTRWENFVFAPKRHRKSWASAAV